MDDRIVRLWDKAEAAIDRGDIEAAEDCDPNEPIDNPDDD